MDLRTSFPSLEDSSGAGVALSKVLEGDAAASKNASAALVGKDPSGNLIYLKTKADGTVLADTEGSFVGLSARGTHAGSTSNQTVATITLTNSLVYKDLCVVAACFRNAVFEVVQIDDSAGTPVETIHSDFIVGAGLPTAVLSLPSFTFTAGSTGVCLLRLRAKNLAGDVSDFYGNMSIQEVQP